MPVIRTPLTRRRSRSRGFSTLKPLGISEVSKFSRVRISATAKRSAKTKIKHKIKQKQANLFRQRSRKTQGRIAGRPKIFGKFRDTILGLSKSTIREKPQETLKLWAGLSKKSKPIKLVDGLVSGVSNRKHTEGSWPTRFIVETATNKTRKQVSAQVQKAFGIPANVSLKHHKITVETLFKKFKTKRYFVVTLGCPRRVTRTSAPNISSALKKLAKFQSVQLEGINIRLQGFGEHVDSSNTVPLNTGWHLGIMNVKEDWQNAGDRRGSGIVIGHPDSGWRPHPEYDELSPNQDRIDINRAHNVFNGNTGPNAALHDTSPQNMTTNLTHGTATGSMMVSAPATQGTTTVQNIPAKGEGVGGNITISGVAPGARVLPVKCITNVVLLGDTNLAHAIEYLMEENVDVISISLGGTPHHSLEDIMNEAVRTQNIIIVCAAGQVNGVADQETHFYHNTVVEPAAYQQTIAVACSTVNDKPWADSFRGSNVDISAPGHNVWFADFDEDGTRQIKYGSGTSFSTALVASVAALWLGFHGKQNLLQQYQGTNVSLSDVFRHLIKETARKPRIIDRTPVGEIFDVNEPWNEELFGAGIINAEALLDAALPNADDVSLPPAQEGNFVSWIQDSLEYGEEVVEGLERLGADTLNDLERLARESEEFAENLIRVLTFAAQRELEEKAKEASDFLQDQWIQLEGIAQSTAGNLKLEAEKSTQELEEAWEEAEDAVEEIAEDIAETTEEVVDAATDLAEDIVEGASDGAEEVIGWVAGWFDDS